MRVIFAVALSLLWTHANSFEYLGVSSGQSPEHVVASLKAQGYAVENPDKDGLVRIVKGGRSGWVQFCNAELTEVAFSYAYQEFPHLLQQAISQYGSGKLNTGPSEFRQGERYVTYYWLVAGEAYSLTLVADSKDPLTEVVVDWGVPKKCKPKSPNNSFNPDRPDGRPG